MLAVLRENDELKAHCESLKNHMLDMRNSMEYEESQERYYVPYKYHVSIGKLLKDSKEKYSNELAEHKELSGQLFAVIQHAISMLQGKSKQSDFVLNMKGHYVFDCSYLIGQISQLTDCEIPQQSLAEIEANIG